VFAWQVATYAASLESESGPDKGEGVVLVINPREMLLVVKPSAHERVVKFIRESQREGF